MKLHYYSETDSLYLELKPEPGAETREITDGVNADLNDAGEIVGLDIDHAWRHVVLTTLGIADLPLRTTKAA